GVRCPPLPPTRDPAIPFSHETVFAATVAGAGRSNLLTQVPIDRWGHCTFTPAAGQTPFGARVSRLHPPHAGADRRVGPLHVHARRSADGVRHPRAVGRDRPQALTGDI